MVLLVAVACQSLGQSEQDSNEVLALETELKQALNGKDTAKFLSLIGPSGVIFGVDGDNEFKAQVQEQFDQKRAAYCVLFDSKCLSRETPHKRLALPPCSAHDLMSRANGWSMEHQITQNGGASQVHLILKPNNDYCANGKDPIEFVFTEFADGWKLVAVGYE
jgi:hypothetical protein